MCVSIASLKLLPSKELCLLCCFAAPSDHKAVSPVTGNRTVKETELESALSRRGLKYLRDKEQ